MKKEIRKKIEELKSKKNAIILAHYYVADEIQDVADFVGDSLELARKAETSNSQIIVLCGVHFMAETAKIIAPNKKVLIPDINAGCPLADSIDVNKLVNLKNQYPDYFVVNYVNTTAAVKTESDLICTSSNAVDLIKSLPKDLKIIFGPDKNLGVFVQKQVENEMIIWDGHCPVHQNFSAEKLAVLKQQYPNALVLAHPEANQEVLEFADFIGSTSKILNFAVKSDRHDFIIATEPGIIHLMKKTAPDKNYIPLPPKQNKELSVCVNMKKHTLEKVLYALENEHFEIKLDEQTIKNAHKPIQKMIQMSLNLGLIK